MIWCITCFLSLLLILTGMFFIFYLVASKQSVSNDRYFVAVEAFENDSGLPQQVYSAYIQANLMNFSAKKPVYVIDHDLSEITRNTLKEAIEPYGRIIFIKAGSDEKLFL